MKQNRGYLPNATCLANAKHVDPWPQNHWSWAPDPRSLTPQTWTTWSLILWLVNFTLCFVIQYPGKYFTKYVSAVSLITHGVALGHEQLCSFWPQNRCRFFLKADEILQQIMKTKSNRLKKHQISISWYIFARYVLAVSLITHRAALGHEQLCSFHPQNRCWFFLKQMLIFL